MRAGRAKGADLTRVSWPPTNKTSLGLQVWAALAVTALFACSAPSGNPER